MRRTFATVVVLALGASFSGCAQPDDPNLIRIVSSLPRSGSARDQTTTMVNGIIMALEEAGLDPSDPKKETYKVGQFKIKYEDMDDATISAGQATADMEQRNAQKAVSDPNVMVYIGTFNSGVAKPAMPILNRANLLMVSPANTAVALTKPGTGDPDEPQKYRPTGKINYVRVVPADDLQGGRSAEFAKSIGVKSVYVLDDKTAYGRGIAVIFAKHCRDLGIEVQHEDSIDVNATDFKSLMATIKAKNPDLVYFGGTTQTKGGQLAKDLVASGMTAKLMVPDGCFEEAFLKSAGASNLNDRCYVTFGGMPPDKLTGRGKEFVEKYEKKFKSKPEGYAVYGYEAANVAIEAIRKAGKKDRNAVREAALAIRDFDGALGKWSFDANGDTTLTTMTVNIVRDGKFEFFQLLGGPASDAADPAAKN